MIQVFVGDKGTGKTKRMIDLANDGASKCKGNMVFLSDNPKGIFHLDSKVRLVDLSTFPISSYDSFIGFILGVLSQDYDIETIFIDSLSCILKDNNDEMIAFLKFAHKVSVKENINFVIATRNLEGELNQVEAEYIAV